MTTLPIVQPDNVQLIAQSVPEAHSLNVSSATKCTDFGTRLLARIEAEGMSDELDKEAAVYIDRAKKTVNAMNQRRSPVTKLFDQIRAEFTGLENSIDPSKKDSVPYAIQQHRNKYAAWKRQEEERQRQEELKKQLAEQARGRYAQAVEDDYRRQFDAKVTHDINVLTAYNQSLSVANFDAVSASIRQFAPTLSQEWFDVLQNYAHKPYELTEPEAAAIRKNTLVRITPQLKEQYGAEIGDYKDTITDALPAKRRELERMAKASAEEAERIKADLDARETAEARRLDEERRRREEEAQASAALKAQASEGDALFAHISAATPVGYQPKATVKQCVVPHDQRGVLAIVSTWWSKEGQYLQLDELEKIFKRQITFANKIANDKVNPEFISSPYLHYTEDIKAK